MCAVLTPKKNGVESSRVVFGWKFCRYDEQPRFPSIPIIEYFDESLGLVNWACHIPSKFHAELLVSMKQNILYT